MESLKDFDALPGSAILKRADAAKLAGDVHPSTIARWSASGGFPPPVRAGALVGYRVIDLRRWLASLQPVRVAVAPSGSTQAASDTQREDLT